MDQTCICTTTHNGLTWSNGLSASSWNRPLSSTFLRNRVGVGVWSVVGEMSSESCPPPGCPPPTLTNQQGLASSGAPELEGELVLLTVHRQVIIVRESLHGRQAAYHYLQTHAPVVDVLVSASAGIISMGGASHTSWRDRLMETDHTYHSPIFTRSYTATATRPPTGRLRTASSRASAIPSVPVLHCQYPALSPPAT